MKTLDKMDEIKDKKHIVVPSFGDNALLEVDVIEDKFLVNVGGEYYIKTGLEKAKEVVKRKCLGKRGEVNMIDEQTFEIVEEYNDFDVKKEANKAEAENNENDKYIDETVDKSYKILKLKDKEDIIKMFLEDY